MAEVIKSVLHRPRLLDLFCGGGGCSVGYDRAGFDVTGVDLAEQPNYPFLFVRADALAFVARNARFFDVIHASPPCQAHSSLRALGGQPEHQDLIPATRELLRAAGKPYVIENVPGAPLIKPVVLCGTMFEDLRVIRHRLFESNLPLYAPDLHPKHPLVFTHDKRKAHYGKLDQDTAFVQVTGGGNCSIANARDAMGIEWMDKHGLNEAIPPAYTYWLGTQAIRLLEKAA